jgi:hypothetical protein
MAASAAFVFHTERRLVMLTGLKARNLPELLAHLKTVSGASIFYHTHHLYLSHHFEKPRFYNAFATWIGESLQERRLAEQIGAIDMLAFNHIRDLRAAIVSEIEARLAADEGGIRNCPVREEFHFCKSKSFVMPTGLIANDPPDFFEKLRLVANTSLYYHFFEARLRLGVPSNDFSQWLEWLGEAETARAIRRLDPYLYTLDELKQRIIACRSAR